MRLRQATALGLVFALGACGTLTQGTNEFSSSGIPEGHLSLSSREIYAATTERDRLTEADAAALKAEQDAVAAARLAVEAGPVRAGSDDLPAAPAHAMPSVSVAGPAEAEVELRMLPPPAGVPSARIGGVPVGASRSADPVGLMQARVTSASARDGVLRIWVASWQDDQGDLMLPSYVLVDVGRSAWRVGQPAPSLPVIGPNHLRSVEMIEGPADQRSGQRRPTPPASEAPRSADPGLRVERGPTVPVRESRPAS